MYSAKEAAIIATGFYTVSATFMVIVARTLSLVEIWNAYFYGTLIVPFVVTAITVRLPPISGMDDTKRTEDFDEKRGGSYLKRSVQAGLGVAGNAPSIGRVLRRDVGAGLVMTSRVVPAILSIGLIGLLAAKYTPCLM